MRRDAFLRTVAQAAGRMPLDLEPEGSQDPNTRPAPLFETAETGRSRLILVAEDNEINQRVLTKQLALIGYTAKIAATGMEALEHLKHADYAMLLTDLHMPRMDGYELTAAIRSAEMGRQRLPIVALTANAVKGEAKRCRDAGMDDYMTKPVQLAQLRDMLQRWAPFTDAIADADGPDLDKISLAGIVADRPPRGTAPANLDVLAGLVGSDPQVIAEMLLAFRRSAERSSGEIRAALGAGNATAAAKAAHMLKSGARSIGAQALSDICDEIEHKSARERQAAHRALLARFDAAMGTLNAFLDALDAADGPAATARPP
jgi:CheY-like chemotaxis protein/HPt (histidine-containing phosphotransfer) domain-containing protein